MYMMLHIKLELECLIFSPVEGFHLVIFEPPQCAIHKQPSSSIVIPSGRPSFSEKMITSMDYECLQYVYYIDSEPLFSRCIYKVKVCMIR